jgi:hypothetical protein
MSGPDPGALFRPATFARIAEGYDLAFSALKKRNITLSDDDRGALATRVIDLALLTNASPQLLCDTVIAELWPDGAAGTANNVPLCITPA